MSTEVKKVYVDLGDRGYEIVIGSDLLQQTAELSLQAGVPNASTCLVVTDANVAKAGHLAKVVGSLRNSGFSVTEVIIPPGESSKSYSQAETLFDQAFDAGLDRQSTIFALGGGVVGDLAGFIAATYMRGIRFVQIPTTVLAHDSSVGGKVAVNHPKGKNVIGAFHQPQLVIYDISTLQTLPLREIKSGLAEVIKHGIIWDADFFKWMQTNLQQLLALDQAALTEMLAKSCSIKAEIVAKDEKEQSLRAILNFGHTLGHAVETLSRYGTYTHGEAVSIGMVFAAYLSNEMGMIDAASVNLILDALKKAGLPTDIPADLDSDKMIQSMRQDKKATAGQLTFVLLSSIGKTEIIKEIEESKISSLLERSKGGLQ